MHWIDSPCTQLLPGLDAVLLHPPADANVSASASAKQDVNRVRMNTHLISLDVAAANALTSPRQSALRTGVRES